MDNYVGCRVSLDCGGLGFFQGVICRISLQEQTVTLEKPFQNGLSSKFPEITLNASDIQELKILKNKAEMEHEEKETSVSSTIKVEKKQVKERVVENLKPYKEERGYERQPPPLMSNSVRVTRDSIHRASPRFRENRSSPKRGYDDNYSRGRTYSENGGSRTPSRQQRTGVPGDLGDKYGGSALTEEELQLVEEEFDFEGNLAMFDKKAEMAEIEAELLSKQPDIVRLVHCNKRQPEAKYRNDENVLEGVKVELRQITTGETGEGEFITDQGLVVPAISLNLRERLHAVIANHGLTLERQAEVMGRAATELSLQLLGGGHRLNPTNMHQVPTAIFLCGINSAGTLGLAAARHLAGHGVRSLVYLPDAPVYPHALESELRLYRLTGGKVITRGKELPQGSVDLIVTAMDDQEMWSQERCQPWHRAAVSWAESRRAPVLAIDPPPHVPALNVKMSIVGSLPLSQPKEVGQLYLANIGIPKNMYKEVGIKFASPFGSKFVIPLHHSGSS